MQAISAEPKSYGDKLRKLRTSRNLSQLQLEVAADLSIGSISRTENSRINPSKETLFKIAAVLHLTAAETVDLFCINENLQWDTTFIYSRNLKV